MQNFKDKIYNYQSPPPDNIWGKIVADLDAGEQKVIQLPGLRKRSRFLFYGLTAAASLIIILISSLFFKKEVKNPDRQMVSSTPRNHDSLMKQGTKDSLNNITLESIIQSSKDKSLTTPKKGGQQKKYITIAGPGGQPVKISSKVATLIVSADNDYPPRPVWDKKINRWKQIMLSSTLSPTATNLIDIVELSSMRSDN